MHREAKLGLAVFIGSTLVVSALFSRLVFGPKPVAAREQSGSDKQLPEPLRAEPASVQSPKIEDFDSILADFDMNLEQNGAGGTATSAGRISNPTVTTPQRRSYVIEPGDSLWSISEKVYGSGIYHENIKAANPDIDLGATLRTGTKIVIPPIAGTLPHAARRQRESSPGQSADSIAGTGGRKHVVMPGETLSVIARKYYGKASMWDKIRKANPGVNPRTLRPGTILVIP